MNTPTTPTPDLESFRKAVQEFQPNPHRVPFTNLKPFHDSIVELRGRQASYAAIAELLQQHGIKTSRARVAEYGRIALEGGKSRKRRKRTKPIPMIKGPAVSPNVPAVPVKPALAAMPPTDDLPPPPIEHDPYKSRGPRIARIRMADGSILSEKTSSSTP